MLELHHIDKRFDNYIIVAEDINFQAANGEITAILGASGSGKSTLLNMVAGLVSIDNGSITLNQHDITYTPTEQRNIAMMFQDFALFPHLNVWQNVAFGLKMRKVPKERIQQIIQPLLEQLGLANKVNQSVQTLSGGEQQRTALARALAITPTALLLDEPFSNIDKALREQLQTLVCQLVQQHQIPTLMVTHDASEACSMAKKIILFAQGKIIQQGTPQQLLQNPISAEAARLLGCLNVKEQYYIPPESIKINSTGKLCAIQHIFRQPMLTQIAFSHPKYGSLTTLIASDIANQFTTEIPIQIEENRIIYFQAA